MCFLVGWNGWNLAWTKSRDIGGGELDIFTPDLANARFRMPTSIDGRCPSRNNPSRDEDRGKSKESQPASALRALVLTSTGDGTRRGGPC